MKLAIGSKYGWVVFEAFLLIVGRRWLLGTLLALDPYLLQGLASSWLCYMDQVVVCTEHTKRLALVVVQVCWSILNHIYVVKDVLVIVVWELAPGSLLELGHSTRRVLVSELTKHCSSCLRIRCLFPVGVLLSSALG